MNQSKLWTKDFLILAFVNFFVALNFYLLMVVMSVFAMDRFGSSPSQAGLAASIYVIGALFARLFSGNWIERIGRRKLLFIGLILALMMSLSYFKMTNVSSLLTIRFLHGVSFGLSSTALATVVTSIIPKDRRGEGIGYYMLSVTLATALGPFLGMFLSRYGSFNLIFMACSLFAFLSLLISFFLNVPEIQLSQEYLEEIKGFRWSNFFEIKAVPISIVCAMIYLVYSSLTSFLTAYSKEINLTDSASFFFIVFAIAILVSRPFTGRLFDSKGENTTMYPAILVFMLGMLLLSRAHGGYTLLFAGALIGLGFGVVQASGQAISVKVTPSHRVGLANSTFYMFLDFGSGIGPVILGFIIPFTGYRGMYLFMGIFMFFCLFLYYVLHGSKVTRRKNTSNSFAK